MSEQRDGRVSPQSHLRTPLARGLRRFTLAGAALGGLVFTIACEPKSTKAECKVTAVAVSPNAPSIVTGATVQVNASVSSSNCTPVPVATWASSAGAVATVSTTGLVTGLSAGTATITATAGGTNGTATVTVTVAPINTLEIQPASSSIALGGTVTLTAIARDAQGTSLTGRTITWASLQPAIVTVTTAGVVTGVAAGTATVTASSEGKTASAAITVTPPPVATVAVVLNSSALTPGQSTQAVATLRSAQGATLSGRVTTWSTTNAGVATVDGSGIVAAVSPGSATITATSEGQSGTAVVTVTQVPVATISLSLGNGAMRVGDVQVGTAVARDANGAALAGRPIAWVTSNAAVATVTQAGVITAVGVGAAAITASSEGQFSSVAITVTQAVSSITLTITPPTIVEGQSAVATAVAKDGSGNTLPGVSIIFATSNAAVATISAAGSITGVAPGVANITATSGSTAQSVALSVTAVVVPVAAVTVTPTTGSLVTGQTLSIAATPRDGTGNPLTGRVVTWSSSAATVASVSTSGTVTGVSAGTATITALVEGKSAAATITVTNVPVETVTLTTPSSSISVGTSVQSTVVLKDAGGNTLTGRTVTYTSSNLTIAVVNAQGVISGIAAGATTITAMSEGKNNAKVITVLGVPSLSVVSVSPTNSATNVTIESTVQVTFSDNINPATVSDVSVMLKKGGVSIPATRTVSQKTVTVTPTALLSEFATGYEVTVTTAVQSTIGNTLPSSVVSSFSTAFWDPAYYYRLTNDFLVGEALDIYPGTLDCFNIGVGSFSGQHWYFLPAAGSPGFYTMHTLFTGSNMALEGADSPTRCFMTGNNPPLPTGMLWKPAPWPFGPGKYYLQNMNFGAAKSLDTPFQGNVTIPSMQPTGAFTGQAWTFTRLFKR
ncbi:MAG: Ig-like domain-containing protein [Gemmatimonadetes bacterium]|nr:Ig-like domain-containing protein [Gemmatimonadota bacterium]MCC6770772.1 Ig-like domain-containing protein [Gemmatimonadaceae bacterium]